MAMHSAASAWSRFLMVSARAAAWVKKVAYRASSSPDSGAPQNRVDR